jgi:ubiquinone/menaquinone biosynthesis C-methylase UbiE
MLSELKKTQLEKKHKKDVADYFSKTKVAWQNIYKRSERGINFYNHFMMQRQETIIHLLNRHMGNQQLKVLDAGCGPGVIIDALINHGHHVVGIDITSDMVKEANRTIQKYSSNGSACLLADIEALPFKNSSFDVVICSGVLQYLPTDQLSTREMSRLIKNNGLLIVTLPNILRINILFDPFYYFFRGTKYISHKLFKNNMRRIKELSPNDFHSNDNFRNRRYWYWQLNGLCKQFGLKKFDALSVGYGPLTFCGKEFLSRVISLKISMLLDKLSKKRSLRWITFFANRWVFCYYKIA